MAAGLEDQQHRDTAQHSNSKHRISERQFEANSAPVIDTNPTRWAKERVKEMKDWNTKNLSQRLVVDAGCAVAAGAAVAPVVSMIDK